MRWTAIVLMAFLIGSTLLLAQTTQPADRAGQNRLRQVMQGVMMYANENRGYLPERLSKIERYFGENGAKVLLPDGAALPKDFADRSADEQAAFIDANTDIEYLFTTPTRISRIREPQNTPAVRLADANDPSRVLVGYVDGHVEAVDRAATRPATRPATGP